jgi:hypothetical protein
MEQAFSTSHINIRPPNNDESGAIKTSMTFRLAKTPNVSANTKARVPVKPAAGTVAKR